MMTGRWSPAEDAALRAAWPRWCVVRAALPTRTFQSIRGRVIRLGLRCARRARRPWTPADDALLKARWGEDCGRTLAKKLRRTQTAIYRRAQDLQLGRQDRGRAHVTPLARRLGLAEPTLYRLLAECGLTATAAAPVRVSSRHGRHRSLVADGEAAEVCLRQRDTRAVFITHWAREVGVSTLTAQRWAWRAELVPDYGSRRQVRYPAPLLDELRTGPGAWHAIWRAILAIPEGERTAAPWCLALAVHDRSGSKEARAWVEVLPGAVQAQVRRLVRALGLLPRLTGKTRGRRRKQRRADG